MDSNEYCFLWIDWWATCLNKNEWASWVMAVGTILAVVAAIYVPYRQEQNNRKAQRHEAFQKKLGLITLCSEFSHEVRIAMEKVVDKFSHDNQRSPYTSFERLKTLQETALILLDKDLPIDCAVVVIKLAAILSLTLNDVDMAEDENFALYHALQGKVQRQLENARLLDQRLDEVLATFKAQSPK